MQIIVYNAECEYIYIHIYDVPCVQPGTDASCAVIEITNFRTRLPVSDCGDCGSRLLISNLV